MSGCPFCQRSITEIDYKDAALLRAALKDDGTLRSRRGGFDKRGKKLGGTRACRRHQSQLATAVKRARFMALLPTERPPKEIKWPPKERKKNSSGAAPKRRRRRAAMSSTSPRAPPGVVDRLSQSCCGV